MFWLNPLMKTRGYGGPTAHFAISESTAVVLTAIPVGPSLDWNLLESRPFRVVNRKQLPAMQLGGLQWALSTEAAGQNLNTGPGLRAGEGHTQGPVTFPSLALSLLSSILLFSISTSSLVPLSTMTSSSWKAAPHWRAKGRRQIRHHAEGKHPWTLTLSPTAAPQLLGSCCCPPGMLA